MKLWFPSWLLELRSNSGKGLSVQNANPAIDGSTNASATAMDTLHAMHAATYF